VLRGALYGKVKDYCEVSLASPLCSPEDGTGVEGSQ